MIKEQRRRGDFVLIRGRRGEKRSRLLSFVTEKGRGAQAGQILDR